MIIIVSWDVFASIGDTTRVSVDSDGNQSNAYSWYPDISADGRFIAFMSSASNLVQNDTNQCNDVFVHDHQTGETTRVSIASDGSEGNSDSFRHQGVMQYLSISGNGRFVAFQSGATNLVPNVENLGQDVFMHDRETGETTRVSVGPDGSEPIHSCDSYNPSISYDGRYVVFTSTCNHFIDGDTNSSGDIFLYDRQSGVITRISNGHDGTESNGHSSNSKISDDGRYIVFYSTASNLVENDTNEEGDIFVFDTMLGETTRVSVSSNGDESNDWSFYPSISADGRYVAFMTRSDNFDPRYGIDDIFIHDRQTKETSLVSVSYDGNNGGNDRSEEPSLSSDGRYVAFRSKADNLVPGDEDTLGYDIFVRDLLTGETKMVSGNLDGAQSANYFGPPSISDDGSYVTFSSDNSQLIPDDTNGASDIFVHHYTDGGTVPPFDIDLDVSEATVDLAYYTEQTKESQPFTTVLETSITNHGPDEATNVLVEFFNGHPDLGDMIASSVLSSIESGETSFVNADWVTASSQVTAEIFVRVSASENEVNPSNDVSKNGTNVYIAFADYSYDPDTFHFKNFTMGWSYFTSEMYQYSSLLGGLMPTFNNMVVPGLYGLMQIGGNCYGMSAASLIYWDTPSSKPVAKDTYQMLLSEVEFDIQKIHVRQLIKELPVIFFGAGSDPAASFSTLKNRLSKENSEISILNLASQWGDGGHAVIVYKIVEIGNKKYIYVYDSNAPENTDVDDYLAYANIMELDEGGDFLSYPYYDKEYIIAYVSEPIRSVSEITSEMIEDLIEMVFRNLIQETHIQGFFSWGVDNYQESRNNKHTLLNDQNLTTDEAPFHFLITDGYGNEVGYNNGVFVNNLPGAEFDIWDSGFYWLLPEGDDYTLQIEGNEINSANLSFVIPQSENLVQITVFSSFDVPQDIVATTNFSQDISDWEIELEGQDDILPNINEQINIDEIMIVNNAIYLPLISN